MSENEEPGERLMNENRIVDDIARGALRSLDVGGVISQLARKAARQALRASVQPFLLRDVPSRPSDPAALSSFFDLPTLDGPQVPQPKPMAAPLRTKEDQARFNREFFALAFRDERVTLEDLTPARIRVFYRICREMARRLRLLDDNATLSSLPAPSWLKSLSPPKTTDIKLYRVQEALRNGPDLSILPPSAPVSTEEYDPEQDKPLVHYCQSLRTLADDLLIMSGTTLEPQLGKYGLKGLLEPTFVRLAAPSPEEILDWEDQLVTDTLDMVTARGTKGAIEWLNKTHGLLRHEALPLIVAAQSRALDEDAGSLEEKRAIMLRRLEDLGRRARKALQPTHELGALKLQALVRGFARVEPEDELSMFTATVRKVNSESPKQLELDDEDAA